MIRVVIIRRREQHAIVARYVPGTIAASVRRNMPLAIVTCYPTDNCRVQHLTGEEDVMSDTAAEWQTVGTNIRVAAAAAAAAWRVCGNT